MPQSRHPTRLERAKPVGAMDSQRRESAASVWAAAVKRLRGELASLRKVSNLRAATMYKKLMNGDTLEYHIRIKSASPSA